MPSYRPILTQVLIQICSISVQNQASPQISNFGGTSKKKLGATTPIYPPNRHTKSPPLVATTK